MHAFLAYFDVRVIMHWLANNYEWVFSGIGVTAIGVLVTLFLRRSKQQPSTTAVAVSGSTMIGSPTAIGSNIVQAVQVASVASDKGPTPEYREKPAPDEIIERISKMPLYEQPACSKSYVGVKVRWLAMLRSIERWHLQPKNREESGEYYVHMKYFNPEAAYAKGDIIFFVNIEDYPRLKIAKQGDKFMVTGTIRNVDGDIMRLEDVRIFE